MSREMNSMYPYSVDDISPLCQFPEGRINLIGIEENFLNSVDTKFYNPV